MANANLTMGVNGIDKTGAAFNSIKNRAKVTGAQIRSIMGGAIAAAGSYLSVRAIKGAIDEMQTINDVAMRANASAEEIQKLTKALNILGIQGADISSVAVAMARMEKSTGKSGLKGFYETIGAMGQLTSASERAQAAIKVFGRSGLVFMPLVNAAKDGTDALQGVVDSFGAVTNASARAADDIADGTAIVTGTFKKLWYEALGTVAQWVAGEFGGSFRQSMMALSAYIDYWLRDTADRIRGAYGLYQTYFKLLLSPVSGAAGALFGGGSIKDAWAAMKDGFATELKIERDSIEDFNKRAEERERRLQDALAKARDFERNYQGAAKGGTAKESEGESTTEAAKPPRRISNQLILGGSNAARKLQILGPEYQSEQKKQTALLKTIADNTKQTAENTDDAAEAYTPTDL